MPTFGRSRRAVAALAIAGIALGPAASRLSARTDLALTVDDNKFEIDGTPKFLVFVSYFDALDVSSGNLASNFGALKSMGVDGVRIFPNWWSYESPNAPDTPYGENFAQDTVIAPDGSLRTGPLADLLTVLDIAKAEGLLVDMSFSAETVKSCGSTCYSPGSGDLDTAELTSALADIAAELEAGGSAYKHVLIDIQNEGDYVGPSDGVLDEGDIEAIAAAIRAEFNWAPLTISYGDAEDAASIAEDAGLDVATLHEPRFNGWWNDTDDNVAAMDNITSRPIYLQEPSVIGEHGTTIANLTYALEKAAEAGAAAFCFHTRAGFFMDGEDFFEYTTGDENDFLSDLADIIDGLVWGA